LTATIDDAKRSGHIRLSLVARLWLAEIEIRSGQRDLGRAHLASTAKDAGAKGLTLIARRATAAMAK